MKWRKSQKGNYFYYQLDEENALEFAWLFDYVRKINIKTNVPYKSFPISETNIPKPLLEFVRSNLWLLLKDKESKYVLV